MTTAIAKLEALGIQVHPNMAPCAELVERLFDGFHHAGNVRKLGWNNPDFIEVPWESDFATYDFNALTRLCFLAHDLCVRAAVVRGRKVKIRLHPRKREAMVMSLRHPTIEEALEVWRMNNPAEKEREQCE